MAPPAEKDKDKSKVHKLSIKGSAKLVSEFLLFFVRASVSRSRLTFYPRFQRGVYPAEDFTAVKKYGLNMLVSADDQVRAYIKKIMGQLDRWMAGGQVRKLVLVITDKDTGEHVERWQFDVQILAAKKKRTEKGTEKGTEKTSAAASATTATYNKENAADGSHGSPAPPVDKTEAEIQAEIAALFRQITASVTFLPQLAGDCTFNVLVYADAASEVPVEWGDSDAKEIENGERVQLRGFSTSSHRVDTLVSYRLAD
ncbi:mitotic spindle checkpoint component mad2 [Niveomyces insectorum RCEF 264]|uniref:Mitotic spindle checkpoint component mad2 n=1 Tax=Niveomyces insectorum RCEF 264 TaxID=1081102 RepID=A0A167LXI4_9HYPO|nr:mitotic spindle checkpoint component mad2 [Niveomyces insectorum RCEF 264]